MRIDSFIYDGDGRSLSDRLRAKGFLIFVPIVIFLMFLLITLIGIFINWLYDKPFNFEDHVYQELPFDAVLSVFFGVVSYFHKGKRLKLKSDVIELNLGDKNRK